MARQTVQSFLKDTWYTSITEVEYVGSYNELMRRNVVAAFGRQTMPKEAILMYVANPENKKAQSFNGWGWNIVAWPFLLLRSLRTSINYAINKIDATGEWNLSKNQLRISPVPQKSSKLAMGFKLLNTLIFGIAESLCYVPAKLFDLVTGGVTFGSKAPAPIKLEKADSMKKAVKQKESPKNVVSFEAAKNKMEANKKPEPLKKSEPVQSQEQENTAQIYKDLHEQHTHAHPVGKKVKEVQEHFEPIGKEDIGIELQCPQKGKGYYDPEYVDPREGQKSDFLETYGDKVNRKRKDRGTEESEGEHEGEGEPFEPPVMKHK